MDSTGSWMTGGGGSSLGCGRFLPATSVVDDFGKNSVECLVRFTLLTIFFILVLLVSVIGSGHADPGILYWGSYRKAKLFTLYIKTYCFCFEITVSDMSGACLRREPR